MSEFRQKMENTCQLLWLAIERPWSVWVGYFSPLHQGISYNELSPVFVRHEYFTLPSQLTTGEDVYGRRVAKVVYLIQEAFPPKYIHDLLGGHVHWCTAIDNVWLCSFSISY